MIRVGVNKSLLVDIDTEEDTMVYGHYIEDAVGNKRFFVEGCSYCQMSTGGSHESNCPMKDVKVPDMQAIYSFQQVGEETYAGIVGMEVL